MDIRPYQADCLDILLNTDEDGRIVIPTGGGKTLIEASYLSRQLSFAGGKLHLVLAPRIALLSQLSKEYRDLAGQGYIALAFHSGTAEPDYEKVKWQEFATTDIVKVEEELKRAKSLSKDLVIFSTYHSMHKLVNMLFTMVIADESQYLVSENFFDKWNLLQATRRLCFTATEKHTSVLNGRGLNNTVVFGEVLYQVSPKELIAGGWIVPPKLHIMYASTADSIKTSLDEVINLAKYQDQVALKTMPASKILFAMNGTKAVRKIIEDIPVIKKAMPNHKIFTILSNAKFGAMVDGIKVARGNFMKELRECDNALIFHYDILSEGIDIDGITGVAIMRNMTKSKLIQTIGRAVRIFKANPNAKQFALVSVAVLNNNNDTRAWVAEVVSQIRDAGFEINIEEVNFTGEDGPGNISTGIDDQYDLGGRKGAKKFLQDILHEQELLQLKEDLSGMSNQELMTLE